MTKQPRYGMPPRIAKALPFLSVYTPTYLRPAFLKICKASVANQQIAVQHVIIEDEVGLGVEGMYADIRNHAHLVTGKYVVVLSDDNVFVDKLVCADLAQFIQASNWPEVVIWKGHLPWSRRWFPFGWERPPVLGEIDLSNFVLRADIWQDYADKWEAHYQADFRLISRLWDDGCRFAWFDRHAYLALATSAGSAESDVLDQWRDSKWHVTQKVRSRSQVQAAVVSTLGEWRGSMSDVSETGWIAHGPAMLATYGGELYQTRTTTPQHLSKALSGYDVIGISATSATYHVAVQLIEAMIEHDPSVASRIAIGGVHASLRPQDYERFDCRWLIQGHGEPAWRKLLVDDDLPSQSWHNIEDMDDLPFIDRSLWAPEPSVLGMNVPFATFISSRGCPYRCAFCWPAEQTHFGKKLHRRSPQNFVDELREVKQRQRIQMAHIHDDTFTLDPDWISRFCDLAAPLKLRYFIGTRADHVCKHPSMFENLKRVGVQVVSVGFESGSQRILDQMNKQITVEQNILAAKILHDRGLQIFANYMFGFPEETEDDMALTALMIQNIKPAFHSPAIFSPYPGNVFGDAACAACDNGHEVQRTWRRDPSRTYTDGQHLPTIQRYMQRAMA